MNLKSLLIGSAAALSSVTVANAADAIVAAEPEALEYVRVCDAFGTGFFYIPGSETCLRVSGLVRFQVSISENARLPSDWNAFSRAEVNFDARTETELGVLRSFARLRTDSDLAGDTELDNTFLHQAFIQLGGLTVGKAANFWDNDLSGENDASTGETFFNSISYVYDGGTWSAGISIDELDGTSPLFARSTAAGVDTRTFSDNNVGISGDIGVTLGGASIHFTGGYDTDLEEGALRALMTADLGPGTLGLSAVYSSGANPYFSASEWAVSAEYAAQINDKLTITPGVAWLGNTQLETLGGLISTNHWTNDDAWAFGVTVDYAITSGLATKVNVRYEDPDGPIDNWTGFVRLDRSF